MTGSPEEGRTAASRSAMEMRSRQIWRFSMGLTEGQSQDINAVTLPGCLRAVLRTVAPPRLSPVRIAEGMRRVSRRWIMSEDRVLRVIGWEPVWLERPRVL